MKIVKFFIPGIYASLAAAEWSRDFAADWTLADEANHSGIPYVYSDDVWTAPGFVQKRCDEIYPLICRELDLGNTVDLAGHSHGGAIICELLRRLLSDGRTVRNVHFIAAAAPVDLSENGLDASHTAATGIIANLYSTGDMILATFGVWPGYGQMGRTRIDAPWFTQIDSSPLDHLEYFDDENYDRTYAMVVSDPAASDSPSGLPGAESAQSDSPPAPPPTSFPLEFK